MTNPVLRDRRILIVEDEYLIAISLREHLEEAGSIVVGPVPSVDKAIEAIESKPQIDAAVLDVNLGGVMAYPVADALLSRNIPFVFTSGYEDTDLKSRYPSVRNCLKPYLFPQMEAVLASALSA
jgi:CheY-like chemotaxis protein